MEKLSRASKRHSVTSKKTTAWIKDTYGSVDPSLYRFDDYKVTNFDHALGHGMPLPSQATHGGETTINVSQNTRFDPTGDEWDSNWVSAERTITTFDDDGMAVSYVNQPFTGHAEVGSATADAVMADYVDVKYKKLLFKRAEIVSATQETIVLMPQ